MSQTTLKSKTPIVLNVYDLSPDNNYLYSVGLGAYHSGIEINGVEYTFGQQGVVSHPPRSAEMEGQCKFRESVVLGETNLSSQAIERLLSQLKGQFPGETYHVVQKNCNHFTEAVSRAIFRRNVQPGWVNRSANFGRKFSWIFGKKQEEIQIKHEWEPFQGSGSTLSGRNSVEVKETSKSWFGFSGGNANSKPDPVKTLQPVQEVKDEPVSREHLRAIHENRLKRLQKQ